MNLNTWLFYGSETGWQVIGIRRQRPDVTRLEDRRIAKGNMDKHQAQTAGSFQVPLVMMWNVESPGTRCTFSRRKREWLSQVIMTGENLSHCGLVSYVSTKIALSQILYSEDVFLWRFYAFECCKCTLKHSRLCPNLWHHMMRLWKRGNPPSTLHQDEMITIPICSSVSWDWTWYTDVKFESSYPSISSGP